MYYETDKVFLRLRLEKEKGCEIYISEILFKVRYPNDAKGCKYYFCFNPVWELITC